MRKRDQAHVTLAAVDLEDASEALVAVRNASRRKTVEIGELRAGIEVALSRLEDASRRLHQRDVLGAGVPVSDAAAYLDVSEPTVRLWVRRELLRTVPASKPVLVEIESLRRVARVLAELRERGEDRDWLRGLVDLLHDRTELGRAEIREGLDDLASGNLEPA